MFRLYWGYNRVILGLLGLCLGYIGVIIELYWGSIGVLLGLCLGYIGVVIGYIGVILGLCEFTPGSSSS